MTSADDREVFARSLRQVAERSAASDVDTSLDEVGWNDALEVDARLAVSVWFETQGETNVRSIALDRVFARGLGLQVGEGERVVFPAFAESDAPGRIDRGETAVRGLALGSDDGATYCVATNGDGDARVVRTEALDVRPVAGVDPRAGLVEVSGRVGEPPTDGLDWDEGVRLARLAVGHELVGASRRMLVLAREHALDRIQFGRPIAMFQAVRHRLAETLVAIEAADAALAAAWDDGSTMTAVMAKAVAGRSAGVARKHCQQVLAGIGFTGEHEFHRHLRRTLLLDGLFGDTRGVTRRIGATLIDERAMPPVVAL